MMRVLFVVALPGLCGSYFPWLNQPHFVSSPVRLGTQMFADFPQMLAYARSPPNFGGLTADEKKTDFGVGVYDHKAAQLVRVFFVVVVTDDGNF
ncbi:MAG TPA: hypothetical protein O0X19_04350 [Methanocorpusculum sp.]|nr:hypothetical protein [Candidatus Methanocorpusculum equi]MCQ2357948.1 hypothetical protein [Methanocorpusculum sp.]HJJ33592.1 hypothetical protein [Methanocorpusculum sp.]